MEPALDRGHLEARKKRREGEGRERPHAQGHERCGDTPTEARPQQQEGQGQGADPEVGDAQRGQRADQDEQAFEVVLGQLAGGEAEQVLDLKRPDHDRDPGGEAGGHGVGDELDELPHAHGAHDEEQDAGQRRGQEQAPEAEPDRDRREDDDEGGGGAGDLDPRTAEHRDDRTPHDRRVEAMLRRDAGGDGQRHREGQGHDPHHRAGHEVGPEVSKAISLPERLAESKAQAARHLAVGLMEMR